MVHKLTFLLSFSLFLVPVTGAQAPTERGGKVPVELGTIRVNVRNATGAPLSTQAVVQLRQRVGTIFMTQSTMDVASAEFKNLPVGDYVIDVNAAGFEPTTEEATLFSATSVSQVYIHLRPLSAGSTSTISTAVPVLAPKAQKEVQDAAQAIEKNDLNEAAKHLERAEKLAPGHPEVHYLWGMLNLKRNDLAAAKQRLEKAIALYPQHVAALSALGRLLFQQGDSGGAITALEQALVVDGRSQENHAMLAGLHFQEKRYEKARYHSQQALDLADGKLPGMRLLLAQILLGEGDQKQAIAQFETFLRDFPDHVDAPAARNALAQLRGDFAPTGTAPPPPSQPAAEPRSGAESNSSRANDRPRGVQVTAAGARVLSIATLSAEMAPGAAAPVAVEWAPKDVDDVPPAVFRDVTCPTKQVIERAGRRVVDLVSNLRDVNASEQVVHTFVDAYGRPGRSESGHYEYMFSIQRPRSGVLWVDEYRNNEQGGDGFVGGIATTGLAAMALIFHPYYSTDFEMQCEGQGNWRGQPVWYVHFRQREDKPSRIRAYRYERGSVRVPLKGRAWIAANSYQIVRLETDLVAPLKEARLEREHMVVEYGPVEFKERKGTFWLPSSADVYAHERGKRWHRRHTLSNYVHFAVDTKQKIANPEEPEPPDPPVYPY